MASVTCMGPTGDSPEVITCPQKDLNGRAPRGADRVGLPTVVVEETPRVVQLQWEPTFRGQLSGNPADLGGGRRLFADSERPDDPDPERFRQVQVRAKPNMKRAGVRVFFRSFDMDDPTGIKDENGLTDPPEPHPEGILTPLMAETDSRGEVVVQLTVTGQPGDNFKVAAAVEEALLDDLAVEGLEIVAADGRIWPEKKAGPADPDGVVTELLTVWRRLHVEIDAMEPVPQDPSDPEANVVAGFITGIQGTGDKATRVFLDQDLTVTPDEGTMDESRKLDDEGIRMGNGRFENGEILIGPEQRKTKPLDGNGTNFVQRDKGITIPFKIQDSSGQNKKSGNVIGLDLADRTFTVNKNLTANYIGGRFTVAGVELTVMSNTTNTVTVVEEVDIPYVLRDDDKLTQLRRPDRGKVKAAFREVYILPLFDGGGDPANDTADVPFTLNQVDTELISIVEAGWDSRGNNSEHYWVAYLVGAFQGAYRVDGDLDSESLRLGNTDCARGGSLIFLEALKEERRPGAAERDAVVHELGHAFGATVLEPVTQWGRPIPPSGQTCHSERGQAQELTSHHEEDTMIIRVLMLPVLLLSPILEHSLTTTPATERQAGERRHQYVGLCTYKNPPYIEHRHGVVPGQPMGVEVKLDQERFVIGEPIRVHILLTNQTQAPLSLNVYAGQLRLYLSQDGKNFFHYQSERTSQDDRLVKRLEPGEVWRWERVVLYCPWSKDRLVIREAGTYHLFAEFQVGISEHEIYDSEVVGFRVEEPRGVDAEVFRLLADEDGRYEQYGDLIRGQAYGLRVALRFDHLVQAYPHSAYVPALRRALHRVVRHLSPYRPRMTPREQALYDRLAAEYLDEAVQQE